MRAPDPIRFETTAQMEAKLAHLIGLAILAGIAERGRATLALSGGSSPKSIYQLLSATDLPWDKVHITLVDDRWVPPSSAGSNEAFILEHLLQGPAAAATLYGMYGEGGDVMSSSAAVADRLANVLDHPFDVVVMGMGPDGHTASWFPGAGNLSDILSTEDLVMGSVVPATDVTGAYLERMTLTPAALRGARLTLLPLSGAKKVSVFEAVCAGTDPTEFPVRALLAQTPDIWATLAP